MNDRRLMIDDLSHGMRLAAWNLYILRLEMQETLTALAKFCVDVNPHAEAMTCAARRADYDGELE